MSNRDIPIHKMSEYFQSKTIFRYYSSNKEHIPTTAYAHKDDYYVLAFIKKGEATFLIDFKEYLLEKNTVFCITPGQVHLPKTFSKITGWFLAVDAMFVREEYKKIFDKLSFLNIKPTLDVATIEELDLCVSLINRRSDDGNEGGIDRIVYNDLISSFIGLIADAYQKEFPVMMVESRAMAITSQFRELLSANFQKMKRPNEYASQLNISVVYLNEAVKKTTGYSVQGSILNEVIIQAKRLLYYTSLSIKEVALQLGYEDWAYFTRIFTKATGMSPSLFRKRYRD
jgi:AraC-type DNA-binding domain-containing proteins